MISQNLATQEVEKNFNKIYADDFTQVIINKFEHKINDARREIHRANVQEEINRQNEYEKKWKLKTSIAKFVVIAIGYKKAFPVQIGGELIEYSETGKLLGLNFTNNNFFKKQMDENISKAKAVQKRLWRFRTLKKNLKVTLYKTLILPLILYPIVPINACSKTQIKRLQIIQNDAVRWICNEHWPILCPLEQRHLELKIEYIEDRVKRMTESLWSKLDDEDNIFHQETLNIHMNMPHKSYPSSYNRAYEE